MDRKSLKLGIFLMFVAAIAASALSYLSHLTEPIIAENELQATKIALQEVYPQADSFENQTEMYTDTLTSGVVDLTLAKQDGQPAAMIYTLDTKGYDGDIRLMVSFDIESNIITGMRILKHTETPGLGANAASPTFEAQFNEKDASEALSVVKSQATDQHQIEAITAATITSNAVTDGVNQARNHFNENILIGGTQ